MSELLNYDFGEERKFDYSTVSSADAIRHIVRFISGIWQIHAFGEGNTRTTAVFLVKYLRSFGLEVNNESFEKHSWFFRNTLIAETYDNMGGSRYFITVISLYMRGVLTDNDISALDDDLIHKLKTFLRIRD